MQLPWQRCPKLMEFLGLRTADAESTRFNIGKKTYEVAKTFCAKLCYISSNSFSYIGVLTSTWGVRVRRFCGFVAGRGCHTGSRWRCRLVCVGVRVRLSHRVSLAVSSGVCRGQGSAVT